MLTVLTVFLVALFLPGAVLALLAGLRLGTAVAVAPLLSYGVVTACTTVASVVRFDWSPLVFVLAVVLAGLLVVAARWAGGTSPREAVRGAVDAVRTARRGFPELVAVGGVLAGAVTAAGVVFAGFGSFGRAHQDWDYIFHANATRFIEETGNVDPGVVTSIVDWDAASAFYPNTYHSLAAVVRETTGASVFEVLNGHTMLIAALAALGLVGLLRRLQAPTLVVGLTPVLLAGFASFPYDALWRGPLLPYATGIALVPAFFLLLMEVLDRRSVALIGLTGLGAAALLGVQTATALSAGLIACAFVVQRWLAPGATRLRDVGVLLGVGLAAAILGAPAVVGAVRNAAGVEDVNWPAVQSPGQAVGDMLFLNHGAMGPQFWLAALVVVGLVSLRSARYMWWWLAGGGVFFALFVASASRDTPLVEALTRPWWNDRWRFAALVILAFAPLAAHGFNVLAEAVTQLWRTRLPRVGPATLRLPLVAAAGLVALLLLSGGLYVNHNEARMAPAYQREGTLSAAEQEAIHWLGEHSDGGYVMNDPNDGSPYMLAIEGLWPAFGHVIPPGSQMSPRQQVLLEHFNCLDSDPAVRKVIEQKDIRYVFVSRGYIRGDWTRIEGLRAISTSPSLEKVYDEGDVQIYAVDLVDQQQDPIPACTISDNAG
jgi:hypothetical protein